MLFSSPIPFTADDLTTHPSGEEVTVAGLHSILPKEHGNKFYELQILHHHDKDVSAIACWDSSIHDSQYLNRVTEGQWLGSDVLSKEWLTVKLQITLVLQSYNLSYLSFDWEKLQTVYL